MSEQDLMKEVMSYLVGYRLGTQILFDTSEEDGPTPCLGFLKGSVKRFIARSHQDKIPEMGWNSIRCVSPESGKQHGKMGDGRMRSPLFDGIPDESHVYYVHSFAPDICADTIAITEYGRPFSAALGRGNFFGTQFHPEKSGSIGQRLLANFLES